MKSYFVTTPIYYVNASPHIGHYYSTLIADVLARWHRQNGKTVNFQTGTDEHGQKIEQEANRLGQTPQEFTDRIATQFEDTFRAAGFTYDRFIRTSEKIHCQTVQKLWHMLTKQNYIYMGKYSGWYNVSDETFVPKQQVEMRTKNSQEEQYYCINTGKQLVWQEEDNYLFRLSSFQDRLLEHYKNNPNWIVPQSRQREIIKFVEGGLEDLSVSRKRSTCNWGIEISENDIIYVWLDALTNYLSGTLNQTEQRHDHDTPVSTEIYNTDIWPADVHVVGKDILKFHAVYWPAFLMAVGFPLPKKIIAHGWWTRDGEKISKSTGNVFDPIEKSKEYSTDIVRYYLLRETGFGTDGDFVDERMKTRLNSDLADTLGNLVTRVTAKSILPEGRVPLKPKDEDYVKEDRKIIEMVENLVIKVDHLLSSELNIQQVLIGIWEVLFKLNRFFSDQAPWKLKRENESRYQVVIYVILESLRIISLMLGPIIPDTAKRIQNMYHPCIIENPFSWGCLESNTVLSLPEKLILFQKK